MNTFKNLFKDILSLNVSEVLIITMPLYLSCLWSGILTMILSYSFLTILGVYWLLAFVILTPIILYMKNKDGDNWNMNGGGFLVSIFLFSFFPLSLFLMMFNIIKEKISNDK